MVGVSAAVSGVRRATGLSLMQLAKTRISNDTVRAVTVGYLNMGEFIFDRGQSLFEQYKNKQRKDIDQSPKP